MALTDPHDTLAYHSSRVLCAHRNMSDVPCASVASQLADYQKSHTTTDEGYSVPETQALWFYGMNHGVALIAGKRAPLEPLPPWELSFVKAYHRELVPRAVRAFYYLLLICTREARHNKSLTSDLPKISEQFGENVAKFFQSIKGGESGIHAKFVSSPPDAPIGAYCEALRWQFYNSKWAPGYGGKAWGQVTDCLCRFVKGEFSAEMMLDTIWTLSHNNGPIFNKGIFYSMYNPTAIIRILDVQRSGQIPQAILFDGHIRSYAGAELIQWMVGLKEKFPNDIGDYVDWELVEALGSVNKYEADKQKQWAKYGMSPAAKAKYEEALKKKKAQEEAAKKAAEEYAKKWFTVMPNVQIKKVQLVREVAA